MVNNLYTYKSNSQNLSSRWEPSNELVQRDLVNGVKKELEKSEQDYARLRKQLEQGPTPPEWFSEFETEFCEYIKRKAKNGEEAYMMLHDDVFIRVKPIMRQPATKPQAKIMGGILEKQYKN